MVNFPTRILVQRADKLGDVVVALPVLYVLKQTYPTCELHFLTSSVGAFIAQEVPYIDQVVTCDLKQGAIQDQSALMATLKNASYSHYISLWNHPAFAKLGARCGIPVRIGDATDFFLKRYYTHPVRQTWEDFSKHQIEFNLQLLRPFGISEKMMRAPLPISQDAFTHLQGKLASQFDATRKVVFIFAVTGGTNFPIPAAPLKQFIDWVLQSKTYTVILGGQADSGHEFLSLKKKGLINLINKTTFPELLAAISLCDFYVGPDTGPTHVASFLNKPMVFFSSMKPNPPVRWGPLSDVVAYIRKEYVCPHLCVKKCYPDSCFSFVTPELLLEKFESVVQQTILAEPVEIKTTQLLASVRVLYVTTSLPDYDEAYRVSVTLRQQGLMVFPYLLQRWSLSKCVYLIRLVIKHNINVLQGDFPMWVVKLIQWVMGAILVYVKPIYVPIKLTPMLTLKDYLNAYIRVWRSHR